MELNICSSECSWNKQQKNANVFKRQYLKKSMTLYQGMMNVALQMADGNVDVDWWGVTLLTLRTFFWSELMSKLSLRFILKGMV